MGILAQEKGIFKEPISVFGKTVILIIFILFTTRILTRTPLVDYYTPFEILWYLFIISFTIIYALYIFMVHHKNIKCIYNCKTNNKQIPKDLKGSIIIYKWGSC